MTLTKPTLAVLLAVGLSGLNGLGCTTPKSTPDSATSNVAAKSTPDSATSNVAAKSTPDSEASNTAANSAPISVWIDVDTAAGLPNRDIDDAIALIQAFNSPELSIRAVSSVFGNAPLEAGHKITEEICRRFGPPDLALHKGASQAGLQLTPASEALAAALKTERLSILALGPVTNIAAALNSHPDIADRIDELVIVAGRRPGQRFITGKKSARAHRDFNFEKDAEAMKAILQSKIPITLTPWEISSKVWIDRSEIAAWQNGSAASKWLAKRSESWISLWKDRFDLEKFNPFDTLAVARLNRPDLLQCNDDFATIAWAPDDTPDPTNDDVDRPLKPFLHVSPRSPGRAVRYCHDVNARFNADLRRRLTQ